MLTSTMTSLTAAVLIVCTIGMCQAYVRVCYFTNWSKYRRAPAKFQVTDVDPHLCTHIIYAFGEFDADGYLKPQEGSAELDIYRQFNDLKNENPELKTLLALGGWNFGSVRFSQMAADPNVRRNFVNSAIGFLRQHRFDGLDLDWEYPAQRGGSINDKQNFVTLCRELRESFDAEGLFSMRAPLLLTAAVPSNRQTIDAGYDVPNLVRSLDLFLLMTYDLHGGWDRVTGHNSPLYSWSGYTDANRYLTMDEVATYWRDAGVPKNKLVVGFATYGRTFTLSNPGQTGINAPASTGQGGLYTGEAGFMSYYEVCQEISKPGNSGEVVFDSDQQVPYFHKGSLWVGYDDVKSFKIKSQWLVSNDYAGVMFWAIDLDDFNMICPSTTRRYPLINTVIDTLRNRTTESTIGTTPATTLGATPSTTHGQTTEPSSQNTQTTGATPTVPTTGTTESAGFSCAGLSDGMYPDPHCPTHYYVCSHGVAYHMPCPPGLHFNPRTKQCDWPQNVASTN